MFPTEAWSSGTQRRILRVLTEKNRMYTVQELAEMCHRSQPTISRALRDADRYPFISKERVSGSKKLVYGLDTGSEYSTPIREFFRIERRRERRDGTVPVAIWNLLEDVTNRLSGEFDSFYELFLFGSYARGDYYAGSDIDLLFAYTGDADPADLKTRAFDVVDDLASDTEIQLLTTALDEEELSTAQPGGLAGLLREHVPVAETEPLIPLSGNVEL